MLEKSLFKISLNKQHYQATNVLRKTDQQYFVKIGWLAGKVNFALFFFKIIEQNPSNNGSKKV